MLSKTNARLIFLFVLITSLYACQDSTSPQNKNAAIKPHLEKSDSSNFVGSDAEHEDTLNFSNKFSSAIISVLKAQELCSQSSTDTCSAAGNGTTKDCSTNYCDDSACTRKIICCHRIDSISFDELTASMTHGYATFNANQVHAVVDSADCASQIFRFRVFLHRFYFECLNQNNTSALGRKSYYSVPLLKGIVSYNKVDSITVAKGIIVQVDQTYRKIIPFKVYYTGGGVDYFDLSDVYP